jgi:hypothetical protein
LLVRAISAAIVEIFIQLIVEEPVL